MARWRATAFGNPLAPWRAELELAEQDAVDAGYADRFPHGSAAYLSVGVAIEHDAGEPPVMTPDHERWAEALAVLKAYGDRAENHIADRIRALTDDLAGRSRWRQIGDRLKMVRQAQARAAGRLD